MKYTDIFMGFGAVAALGLVSTVSTDSMAQGW